MSAGAAAAAAAAAIANAIKASGVLVRVGPEDFQAVLGRVPDPLVVCGRGGLFYRDHVYLVSYRGFAFYTRSSSTLALPAAAQTITARRIWVPN